MQLHTPFLRCCACCASEARLASTSTFFKTERTHRRRGTRTKICPYNNVSAVLLSCQPTQRGLVVRNTGSSVFDGKFSSAGLVTAASCPLGDTKSQNSRMPNGLYARAKLDAAWHLKWPFRGRGSRYRSRFERLLSSYTML